MPSVPFAFGVDFYHPSIGHCPPTIISRGIVGSHFHAVLRCPMTNASQVDDESPPPFTYTATNVETTSVTVNRDPAFRVCCDCTDGCTDPSVCACMRLGAKCVATRNHCLLRQASRVWKAR